MKWCIAPFNVGFRYVVMARASWQREWDQAINPAITLLRDVLIRQGVPLETEVGRTASGGEQCKMRD